MKLSRGKGPHLSNILITLRSRLLCGYWKWGWERRMIITRTREHSRFTECCSLMRTSWPRCCLRSVTGGSVSRYRLLGTYLWGCCDRYTSMRREVLRLNLLHVVAFQLFSEFWFFFSNFELIDRVCINSVLNSKPFRSFKMIELFN